MFQEEGATMDARTLALSGEPTWIRSGIMAFTHGSKMNSHDWIQTMQCAGQYILAGLYPEHSWKMDAISSLLAACNGILTMTSPKETENRDQLDRLKLQTVEALVKCEGVLPVTELAIVFHALVHVPDAMYRWNSSRNFWSFFGERMMGYYIRFVHNRDLACENICTAYVRMRFLLDRKPGSIASLLGRLHEANVQLPANSMLQEAAKLRGSRPGLPGEHLVVPVPSRRNTRALPVSCDDHAAVTSALTLLINHIRRRKQSQHPGERMLLLMGPATAISRMINGITHLLRMFWFHAHLLCFVRIYCITFVNYSLLRGALRCLD
jgi:hypothetical protein